MFIAHSHLHFLCSKCVLILKQQGASSDVMVGKLDYQTYTSEFESYWVPHSYVPVQHLSKKLCKLQLILKIQTWEFDKDSNILKAKQVDWKVPPLRYHERRKVPHFAARWNRVSYQYLGEYGRFNLHARWSSSSFCYCCSWMAECPLP